MFPQLKNLVKQHKKQVYTVVISTVMFMAYMIMPVMTPQTYISPDETANAYFATQYAVEGKLWYIEPLNLDAFDRLHPRATESHGALVAPSGFWGISVLYGLVGVLLGVSAMHLLTALIAVIASLLFRATVSKLFDERIGWVSWLILLVHPAWWYYASRGWHHNILFVSLLIAGVYALIVRPFTHNVSHDPTVGQMLDRVATVGFFGLAVFIRPIALLWLVPTLLIAMRISGRRTQKIIKTIFVTMVCVVASVFLIRTQAFTSLSHLTPASAIETKSVSMIAQVFPDGFNIKTIARSIGLYYLLAMWWLSIPLAVALYVQLKGGRITLPKIFEKKQDTFGDRRDLASPFAFGRRTHTPKETRGSSHTEYLMIYGAISVILLLWYGSWRIIDNPDPTYISLANSYTRYWLPSFIMSIPLIAYGIDVIAKKTKDKHTHMIIMLFVAGLSAHTVFAGRDGIINNIRQLRANEIISQEIQAIVPEDAIIITNRHDKLFFPHRSILFPTHDAGTFETMRALKDTHAMYVYGLTFTSEERAEYDTILRQLQLRLAAIREFGNEQLYQIIQL